MQWDFCADTLQRAQELLRETLPQTLERGVVTGWESL